MPGYRRARINDAMQAELSVIFREVKDPRIKEAFLTVTACDVTPDLKFAKIYFSHMFLISVLTYGGFVLTSELTASARHAVR